MFVLTTINLIAAGLSILLASALLIQKPQNTSVAKVSLGFLLLVSGFILFSIVSYTTEWISNFPEIIGVHTVLAFLPGPLFLFFCLGLINPQYKFKLTGLFHFIPTICYTIWLWNVITLPGDIKLAYILPGFINDTPGYQSSQVIHMSLVLLHFLLYLLWSYHLLLRNRLLFQNNVAMISLPIAGIWLTFFVRFVFDTFGGYSTFETAQIAHFAISFFVLIVAFSAIRQSSLLSSPVKYRKSLLADCHLHEISNQVKTLIATENLYSDPTMNMQSVADKTGFSKHQISQALNQGLGVNFNELINQFRIEQAKKLIELDQSRSLAQVAIDVGYGSRTTFYSAFKHIVGLSPGQYRKSVAK